MSACFYEDPSGGVPLECIQLKELNGVWSVVGPRSWAGRYYVYELSVYHPSTSRIEKCESNDPYARGFVQIIDYSKMSTSVQLFIFYLFNCSKHFVGVGFLQMESGLGWSILIVKI